MSKRPPEIFIVGTMKGGTTILYDYICTHPRVVAGAVKETHYFSMYAAKGAAWYFDQFPDRAEDIFSIDASPTYFDVATMPTIPAYIKREVPNARIILIVRDPVARAISHFQHLRNISNKEAFASVEIDEFFSRPLTRFYTMPDPTDFHLRHVLDFSVYDEKYGNYVRVFGRENIIVLTNDELRTDPQGSMRRVFDHCNLEWVPSGTFGTQKYLSGSENLVIDGAVRKRLERLFYPSYERFRRQAALPKVAGSAAA